MFYYCPKCADIKKISLKLNEPVTCEVCEASMQSVPSEYLMPGGKFFKSQEARQNFIQAVRSSDTYDLKIGGMKDDIKRAAEEEKQQHIQEMNKKLEQQFDMGIITREERKNRRTYKISGRKTERKEHLSGRTAV